MVDMLKRAKELGVTEDDYFFRNRKRGTDAERAAITGICCAQSRFESVIFTAYWTRS